MKRRTLAKESSIQSYMLVHRGWREAGREVTVDQVIN